MNLKALHTVVLKMPHILMNHATYVVVRVYKIG